MPAKPTAVVLTHHGDYFTVDRVMEALAARGASPLRINADQLGADAGVEIRYARTRPRVFFRDVELTQVKAVWARRVWLSTPPDDFEDFERLPSAEAHRTALISGLELTGARWVNPWTASEAAEWKPRQLALAQKVGLEVPETLITRDAAAVNAFRRRHGRIISKLLIPTVQTMQADARFIYTTEVTADVQPFWTPRIFQPLIPRAREVRMICVGRQVFTASVDPSGVPHAEVDWRRLTVGDGKRWQVEKPPAAVVRATLKLLKALGLTYGACDFIVTPKNGWCFLEVNPAGEYGWLERDLQLPISQAIADAMLERRK